MAGRRSSFKVNASDRCSSTTLCCVPARVDAEINRRAMIFQNGFAPTRLCAMRAPGVSALCPFPMRFRSETETCPAKPTICRLSNAPNYGGGMKIAPDAQLDDGNWMSSSAPWTRQTVLPVFHGLFRRHLCLAKSSTRGETARLNQTPNSMSTRWRVRLPDPGEFSVCPNALR